MCNCEADVIEDTPHFLACGRYANERAILRDKIENNFAVVEGIDYIRNCLNELRMEDIIFMSS